MARKFKDGHIFNTNNSGDIVLLSKEYKVNKYKVMFLEDNTVLDGILIGNLTKGAVNNPNRKTVYGVACIGVGNYTSSDGKGGHSKEYKLWHSMLTRVYNKEYLDKYPTYKNVTICDRWHNFQLFCEDIEKIEGYNMWCLGDDKFHLDKDIKSKKSKEYSHSNCIFIRAEDNIRYSSIGKKMSEEQKFKLSKLNTHPIEHHEKNSITRQKFKKKCKKNNINFECFKEVFHEKMKSGAKKYFYVRYINKP